MFLYQYVKNTFFTYKPLSCIVLYLKVWSCCCTAGDSSLNFCAYDVVYDALNAGVVVS